MLLPILLLIGVGLTASVPVDDSACGYDSCTEAEPGMLNVHIVAHSHDDVGWLKTVDQYYYGSKNYIQSAGVQYILNSVIRQLLEDPKRRFIYVETAFFWRWWMHQSEDTRVKTRMLVRQGRLQFVGGAWSMNDEAAAHYQSIVDQFTWGLRKLNETFGPCAAPHVGWQIDPFGHSREFASLLAAMGYDGLFLGRIDYQDKRNRLDKKTMEMVWRGDDNLGKSSDMFTGVLYNTYSPPEGFCFDIMCSDEPIIDDPDSPMFNVDEKVTKFLEVVKNMSSAYVTKNILVTMGNDFNYQDAQTWFINLDKLIVHTNFKAAQEGLGVKLFYSTPNCYLKAVRDANPRLPTKRDDFFPYASDENSYWTGYFTSKPTTKFFEREGNAYLQMNKQLQLLADLEEHNLYVLHQLMSAMGVWQHHDAITGTEKKHVTHDYERILDVSIEDGNIIAKQAFQKVMQNSSVQPPLLKYDRCRLNESSCDTSTNNERFIVTIYNPLGWEVKEPIYVPVKEGHYEVYAPNGDTITSQIVPIPPEVISIPTRQSEATHEVVFIAYLKPVSYKTFYVKKLSQEEWTSHENKAQETLIRRRRENKRIHELNKSTNEYWKQARKRPHTHATTRGYAHKVDDVTVNPYRLIPDNAPVPNALILEKETEKGLNVISLDAVSGANELNGANGLSGANELSGANVLSGANELKGANELSGANGLSGANVLSGANEIKGANELSGAKSLNGLKNDVNYDDVVLYSGRFNPGRVNPKISSSDNLLTVAPSVTEKQGKEKKPNTHRIFLPTLSNDDLRMLSDQPQVPIAAYEDNEIGFTDLILHHVKTIGDMTYVTLADGSGVQFTIELLFYPGFSGNNKEPNKRSSGAYIFRPYALTPTVLGYNLTKGATGDVVRELRLTTKENAAASIKIYNGMNYIEVDWVIGPISIEDEIGKEFIIKYTTDVLNNGVFFTDSNGRQMLERKLDKRPQWNLNVTEPIAGNYYPVTNKIYIKDDTNRVSVLTDRSEGGSSLGSGQIELMLHRRLLADDGFGVDEPLNETVLHGIGLVARGRHRVFLSNVKNKNDYIAEKKHTIQFHLRPRIFISDATNVSLEQWKNLTKCYSWVNELPEGLHLLTLEPFDKDHLLLRLENYLEIGDRDNAVIDVDIQTIFKTLKLLKMREATLAANKWLDEDDSWSWTIDRPIDDDFLCDKTNDKCRGYAAKDRNYYTINEKSFNVKIQPKQIRTFVIHYWVDQSVFYF